MHNLTGNKKAGLGLGPQRPATIRQHPLNYKLYSGLSSANHKFFLTQGRRVFQRPANWNVRLRR